MPTSGAETDAPEPLPGLGADVEFRWSHRDPRTSAAGQWSRLVLVCLAPQGWDSFATERTTTDASAGSCLPLTWPAALDGMGFGIGGTSPPPIPERAFWALPVRPAT